MFTASHALSRRVTYLYGMCLLPLTRARMTLPRADSERHSPEPPSRFLLRAFTQLPRSMRCRRLRPPDTETTGWEVKAQPQGPQTQGARPHDAGTRPPTSASAALLHAVLVHVQREEHVGASPGVLAGGQCRVQVEGRLLSRGCPQLTLVLELRTDGWTDSGVGTRVTWGRAVPTAPR